MTLDAFADGVGFSEWLTHNGGASFNESGVASIKEYTWSDSTAVAEFFALRTPFALERVVNNTSGYFEYETGTCAQLKAFYEAEIKVAAELALENADIGDSVVYPSASGWYEMPCVGATNLFKSISPETSASWVTPSTQVIGENDGYSGFGALFSDIIGGSDNFENFDAFGTIARGRVISPRYRFTITKEWSIPLLTIKYTVREILFNCAVEDLYDFNYEDGNLPSHAAAAQIGYGNGSAGCGRGDHGLIYRHRLIINHLYSSPFNHLMIPSPP